MVVAEDKFVCSVALATSIVLLCFILQYMLRQRNITILKSLNYFDGELYAAQA